MLDKKTRREIVLQTVNDTDYIILVTNFEDLRLNFLHFHLSSL